MHACMHVYAHSHTHLHVLIAQDSAGKLCGVEVGLYHAGQLKLQVQHIRWPGLASKIPQDCPLCELRYDGDSGQLTVSGALIGIAIVVVVGLLIYQIRRHRRHVKQFLISFFNHEALLIIDAVVELTDIVGDM